MRYMTNNTHQAKLKKCYNNVLLYKITKSFPYYLDICQPTAFIDRYRATAVRKTCLKPEEL